MSDNTRGDEMDRAEEVPDIAPDSIPLPADDGSSNQNEPAPPKIMTSQQGIKNAQKRLRAFSIQKKLPILPKTLAKSTVTGTTVVIGKLSSTKTTPKVQDPDAESRRLPKPPKPGVKKSNTLADSYSELQKRTLSDIENMKRKMELVELGIPLGLICPPPNSDTAMPTKAMPPIKSFLASGFRVLNKAKLLCNDTERTFHSKKYHRRAFCHPSKVDELISEAKKAKAAGKQFKFDYQKLLPDYDNPFQRKKEESKQEELDIKKIDFYKARNRHRWAESSKEKDKDRRKTDRHYEYKKSFDYKKEYRDKDPKDKERVKEKVKEKDKYEKKINKESVTTNEKDSKETDFNLSDYLVCDSWSLDTEEKTSSPKPDESIVRNAEKEDQKTKIKDPMEMLRDSISAGKKKSDEKVKSPTCNNNNSDPKIGKMHQMKKLQPVMDSFRYEIDPDDERDILDIFDDSQDQYSKSQRFFRNKSSYRPSPRNSIQSFNYNEITNDNSQSSSLDEYSSKSNDNFLESVINEIKQEEISDETSQDRKFLVEYELSPEKLSDNTICNTPEKLEKAYLKSGSITPDLEGSYYGSQRSDSSESGFISTESGYKSTESGYKSNDSYRISELRGSEFDYYPTEKMSKSTIASLETWSFVLKICQPLLFRHDNNRCYRSTMTNPKVWYTENPKICNCVKDRVIVYDELETCKMNLVDRVYGCDQLFDSPCLKSRTWYSRINQCLIESVSNLTSNWETDDSSQNSEKLPSSKDNTCGVRNEMCDGHRNEVALDREYEKFMEAVLPESESKNKNIVEICKSNTPTKSQKDLNLKKGNDSDNIIKEKMAEESREGVKRKRKKMRKVSTDDWSEDSDLKRERSHKKIKAGKRREKKKKKDFSSSDSDDSFTDDDRKKHHTSKKKDAKHKSKTVRRKYLSKKRSHKKNKEKKKPKKLKDIEEEDTDSEEDMRKAKESKEKKRTRKKALKRKKKKQQKKRARTKSTSTSESSTSSSSTSSVTSSDSSSSSSDSESEREKIRSKKKREKEERRKRKRKFESIAQSEEFDENILNNIKKERLTDDERSQNKTSDIQDFSPRRQTTSIQRQEIINIKELHNDIVASNLIHIKQEVVEEELAIPEPPKPVPPVPAEPEFPKTDEPKTNMDNKEPMQDTMTPNHFDKHEEVQKVSAVNYTTIEVTQQESSTAKEPLMETTIERLDETKVLSDNNYPQIESTVYPQAHDYTGESKINANADENTFGYEQCYERYEQMDYQQQSDIHTQMGVEESRPIETLVSASGCRGEIKCDWRPGQRASRAPPARPSRWGLKPNEANIVLSGGTTHDENVVYPIRSILDSGAAESHTYRIETISTTRVSKETASPVLGYDEAYEDTYGAADRLAYGDCFSSTASIPAPAPAPAPASTPRSSRSLDARIDRALRETVLGLVTKEATGESDDTQPGPEKGILASKNGARASKRVSFADGYAPGQDSDAEPPPKKKKKKKVGVRGCAWPCPASHPDHVPLWDALPPPDPPPGSPPPRAPPPRAHYLLARCGPTATLPALKVI